MRNCLGGMERRGGKGERGCYEKGGFYETKSDIQDQDPPSTTTRAFHGQPNLFPHQSPFLFKTRPHKQPINLSSSSGLSVLLRRLVLNFFSGFFFGLLASRFLVSSASACAVASFCAMVRGEVRSGAFRGEDDWWCDCIE